LLGILNARGTEESGTFQLIVTGAKVAVLLAFIAGMFAAVGPGTATAEFTSRFQTLPIETVSVAALAFITFFGFSAIAASAGEHEDPRADHRPDPDGQGRQRSQVLGEFLLAHDPSSRSVVGSRSGEPPEGPSSADRSAPGRAITGLSARVTSE